jgi:TolB-like protein/Tfp pilus assembly protein PilF
MSLFNELKRRNVIRVAIAYLVIGWLLAQVSATLEEALHMPEWFDTMVVSLLLIGFPIALFFSWAFELTPEGVKREKDILRDESITSMTAKKLDYVTIAAIIILIGFLSWQQFNLNTNSPNTQSDETSNSSLTFAKETMMNGVLKNSIAVLPFADLSQAGDQEYFSDGISEEILNVLVGVDALKVTSRTSAFQFKGSNKGIPAIAKELKVRHVLEGSVRKSGETLRITAQLIDAQNDKHLWSETYDRPLTTENIFAIQDEISNAIVKALSSELGLIDVESIEVKAVTDNLSAYELYLKTTPLFLARTDLDQADQFLIQALELDPMFAKAWEMRAALQSLMIEYQYSDMSLDESDRRTQEFASKAIKIEPRSALAKAILAKIRIDSTIGLRTAYNIAQTMKLFNEAVENDPNTTSTYNWRGLAYQKVGHLDKSIHDFEKCVELEPLYMPCQVNLLFAVQQTGDTKKTMKLLRQGLNKDHIILDYLDLPWLARYKLEFLFKQIANQEGSLDGWRRVDELYQAYLHPNKDHSLLIRDLLEFIKNKTNQTEIQHGTLLIPIGAHDMTVDPTSLWGSSYQEYRKTATFKSFIIRVGIHEYWLEKGFPPQCRALGESDFECD